MSAAVRGLVDLGTTVLLTTQYLDEADRLADRIAVMQAGRVIAEGTASDLKAKAGGDHLEVVLRHEGELDRARAAIAEAVGTDATVRAETCTVSAPVADRVRALDAALRRLDELAVAIDDIGIRRPTLDDVFLTVTGTHVPADEAEKEVAA